MLPLESPTAILQNASIMPLPPEAIYNSPEECYVAIQAFAKQFNYAFTKRKSKTVNKHGRRKIVYVCDRGRQSPDEYRSKRFAQPRRRNTTTRMTGCEFSVNLVQVGEDTWELRHRADLANAVHNHEPSHSWTSHPSHRKLSKDLVLEVNRWTKAGETFLEIVYQINN